MRRNRTLHLFKRVVKEAGCAIIGQTADLARPTGAFTQSAT